MVDATERLTVLLTEENDFYLTSDYLSRMQMQARAKRAASTTDSKDGDEPVPPPSPKKRKSEEGTQPIGAASTTSDGSSASIINMHWREKICEWQYQ